MQRLGVVSPPQNSETLRCEPQSKRARTHGNIGEILRCFFRAGISGFVHMLVDQDQIPINVWFGILCSMTSSKTGGDPWRVPYGGAHPMGRGTPKSM